MLLFYNRSFCFLFNKIFIFNILIICWSIIVPYVIGKANECRPIYVRWPRVKLNFPSAKQSAQSLRMCKNACIHNEDPTTGSFQECSAFNHRSGQNSFKDDCQIFQKEAVQHTDGYVEADDHFTFYWKYCIKTQKKCGNGDYGFTFLSDRYMAFTEINTSIFTKSLEECLANCLNAKECLSVSFNRTDGGCHISKQNQLTKPTKLKINNDPNYRIDYYENNCLNASNGFSFRHICKENGIEIEVKSKLPYTGALYGLYDFFSCRTEPIESQEFNFFFPFPTVSKNCSDSMRYSGSNVILEVVLSTDGIEPLYFITADDLTYQAKCPIYKSTETNLKNLDTVMANFVKGPEKINDNNVSFSKSESISIKNKNNSNLKKNQQNGVKLYTSFVPTTTNQSILKSSKHFVVTPSTFQSTTLKLTTKEIYSLPLVYTLNDDLLKDIVNITQATLTLNVTSKTTQYSNQHNFSRIKKIEATEASKTTKLTPNYNTTSSLKKVEKEKDISLALNNTTKSNESNVNVVNNRHLNLKPTTNSNVFNSQNYTKNLKNQTYHRPGLEPITSLKELVFRDSTVANNLLNTYTPKKELNLSKSITTSNYLDAQTPLYKTKETKSNFSFSTFVSFPTSNNIMVNTMNKEKNDNKQINNDINHIIPVTPTISSTKETLITTTQMPSTTTLTTTLSTTTTTQKIPTTKKNLNSLESFKSNFINNPTNAPRPPGTFGDSKKPTEPVIFDIFHNGQTTDAVVVGSRITLTFTPYFAVPPTFMSISGCQVEPIGSLYEWEKEPLAIIKDGCQADHVGLVCPPQKTDFGIRVTVESFRYQTTTQIQYTCLIRICPFAVCPQTLCNAVEGCSSDDILSQSFNFRSKRHVSLEQIRAALAANPYLEQQLVLDHNRTNIAPIHNVLQNVPSLNSERTSMNPTLQQQLIMLGGDHIVRKRLIVVNSEEELQYYVKTGEVPNGQLRFRI